MTIPCFRLWMTLLASIAITACGSLQSSESFLGVVQPYRIEVVQGNVLTQEQVAQVKPGQSRAQVRDALGSPLLTDIFHADRWDYVFTIKRQGVPAQQRRVVALFSGDSLKSIEGATELPSERDFVKSIDTFKLPTEARSLTLTPEEIQALSTPAASPNAAASAPAGPMRTYPPLERS